MARASRHNLDQCILESWHRHEAADPDVSTERLMAMVRDVTRFSDYFETQPAEIPAGQWFR
jgi:hypothetical protein